MNMKKKEACALVKAMMASVIPYVGGVAERSKEIPSKYDKEVISGFLKLYKKSEYAPTDTWEHNIIADCYAALRNN